tara:strand:- start:702 stop:1895 length:1194 start_codon:yes stop_codon:yes gene_type:complete
MSSENKKDKVWHKQQENILKKWSEIGSSYRFMHDKAYLYFEKQNFRFALPVIVLSTVTGTANFAQGSFPASWAVFVPLFIGFLNLTAGLLTTVAQFLRVSELLEGHRSASISYSKFSRNISVELSLPPDERSSNGRDFIASSRVELDRLIEQSPNIPLHIVKYFGKSFSGTSFIKPDILEITDVEIFNDSEKKKMLEDQRVMEMKDMENKRIMEMKQFELDLLKKKQEHENNLISKIRKDEAKLRKEFEDQMKVKLDEARKNLKNKRKIKAIEKKKKISINTISNSMSSLIKKLETSDKTGTILTPVNSDTSSGSSSDSSTPKTEEDTIDTTIIEEISESESESESDSPPSSPNHDGLDNIVIDEENEIIYNNNHLNEPQDQPEDDHAVIDISENIV